MLRSCACVRDIIQMSTLKGILKVLKDLREGLKKGHKERAYRKGLKRELKERALI